MNTIEFATGQGESVSRGSEWREKTYKNKMCVHFDSSFVTSVLICVAHHNTNEIDCLISSVCGD